MQILGLVGGTGLALVVGAVFVLNQLNRGSRLAFDQGMTQDEANGLNQEVNDWLRRRQSEQG
ncbi:MAG: hypothetical protein AB7K24_34270 [Gemmataceae bacterium]